MDRVTTLLVWGSMAHLVADWLLQTEWMVRHKQNLCHPAAWVHGTIHAVALGLFLPWPLALVIGLSHILIDSRKPVIWWKHLVGKTVVGPQTLIVEIAVDQVMHVLVLAAVIGVVYG